MVDATTASMATGAPPNSKASVLKNRVTNSIADRQSNSSLGTKRTITSPLRLNEKLSLPVKAQHQL